MKMRNLLLAATMLALPAAVQAQPVNGIYIGGGLGYTYTNQWDGKNINSAAGRLPVAGANMTSNGGFIGLGSIGYGFGNGLRAELEGSYRSQTMRASGNNAVVRGGGTLENYGVMVNAFYDFNVGSTWIYPYVGAGIGYVFTGLQNGKLSNAANTAGVTFGGETKGSFGYQGIIGAAFPIASVPGLSLTAEGRFLGTTDNTNYAAVGNGLLAAGRGISVGMGPQYNWSGLVGVRYNFGVAPAPVVAPPVAVAPAKTYLVFFDWDKYNLSARAKQIIADAAAASTKVQTTTIEVNGYTDTSGSAAWNMGLSVRRANAVAAELIRLGVPKNAIIAKGFGETNLLVPTGPNVREPQNRRVEIILK